VLGQLVQGLADGFLQPLIMLVLVQVSPPEKRRLAMAMFTMGVTAAVGIGPAVGGVIIEAYQWQLIFLAPLPFA
jgi:MFS transporter, DHA2 family, lincomycin resistance protein